ncbi:MAG: hypothetical protein WAW06_01315 [bacterium]
MAARALAFMVGLLLAVATVAVSGETWYDVQERCSAQVAGRQKTVEQIGEIEVASGVMVRADIWEDDYVPSYAELIEVGFLPEDASHIREVLCSWGQIKLCFAGFYNDCCPKKNDEGGQG